MSSTALRWVPVKSQPILQHCDTFNTHIANVAKDTTAHVLTFDVKKAVLNLNHLHQLPRSRSAPPCTILGRPSLGMSLRMCDALLPRFLGTWWAAWRSANTTSVPPSVSHVLVLRAMNITFRDLRMAHFLPKKFAFVQYLPGVSTARLALLSSCFMLTANGGCLPVPVRPTLYPIYERQKTVRPPYELARIPPLLMSYPFKSPLREWRQKQTPPMALSAMDIETAVRARVRRL